MQNKLDKNIDISIVVPAYDEDECLMYLEPEIRKVMEEHQFVYEIIIVDDGSPDRTWEEIEKLAKSNPRVGGIRFRRNYGKAAALNEGFKMARGRVVVTMDADLQDRPEEVPEMFRMIEEEGYDIVSGWKQKRKDPITKTIPTKFFNWAARVMSGIHLHDFNCGLKAYRNAVVKNIEVYGEMHRYIPIIAKTAGFKKITEKKVAHIARPHGSTKYGGISRFIRGPLDLISISFMSKFSKKPMHFFGLWGSVMFMLGFSILFYLALSRLAWAGYGMTERPMFYFGILTVILGSQLFLTGFLAELVSRNAPNRNKYSIGEHITPNLDSDKNA